MVDHEQSTVYRTCKKKVTCCLAVVAAAAAIGCGVSRARALGVNEAARVHQLLEVENYNAIYASAGPQFRQSVTEQNWIALCSAARQKLGEWRQSTVQDTKVIVIDSGGYVVVVDYATDFEKGHATESLSLFVDGGKAILRSYTINSPALSRVESPGI